MQKNNIGNKLFDAILKVAAEEALRQEMEEMPSYEELNERYKPSPELDKKIKIMISRHTRKEKTSRWKKTAIKITASAALVIVISSAVLLSVEATRNYIFNAIIKWQEDHFLIEHSENNEPLVLGIYRPAYLPGGFEEVSSNIVGDIIKMVYQNETGLRITFKQFPSQTTKISFDNEYKEYTKININGQDAYLLEANDNNKDNSLIWEFNGVLFEISSDYGIESIELVRMAESIKK